MERVNRRGGFDLAADRLAFMYVPTFRDEVMIDMS